MSIQRAYAQRNTNLTQIIPEFYDILPDISNNFDISGSAVYVLNLPNVQSTGGVFYVDMSADDTSGNLLDLSGVIRVPAAGPPGAYRTSNIVNFIINIPFRPSYAPGLECTIFFKNIPYSNLPGTPPLLTIGIVSGDLGSPPVPYIFSPPLPSLIANVANSLTFKSDGTQYNVVSSGPAGWLGIAAFLLLLGFA